MKHNLRCEACGKFVSDFDIYFGKGKRVKVTLPYKDGTKREQIIFKTTCQNCQNDELININKSVGELLEKT